MSIFFPVQSGETFAAPVPERVYSAAYASLDVRGAEIVASYNAVRITESVIPSAAYASAEIEQVTGFNALIEQIDPILKDAGGGLC